MLGFEEVFLNLRFLCHKNYKNCWYPGWTKSHATQQPSRELGPPPEWLTEMKLMKRQSVGTMSSISPQFISPRWSGSIAQSWHPGHGQQSARHLRWRFGSYKGIFSLTDRKEHVPMYFVWKSLISTWIYGCKPMNIVLFWLIPQTPVVMIKSQNRHIQYMSHIYI